MPDNSTSLQRPATGREPADNRGVIAGWDDRWAVINLRGDPADGQFLDAVVGVLGVSLPIEACSTRLGIELKVIWAGPDDWFILSRQRSANELVAALKGALQGIHHAVTDVTGGYTLLSLGGHRVRELLAQGCPLDLHPSRFCSGQSAGTVYFKASVWLWQTDDSPSYEVLVRTSFRGYVWLMVEQSAAESGLVKRIYS
jgi:sarcosine oxidase, subunit gamma